MFSATVAPWRCEMSDKPLTDARYQVNGRRYGLEEYLKRQNVSGMLVLKDGKIA